MPKLQAYNTSPQLLHPFTVPYRPQRLSKRTPLRGGKKEQKEREEKEEHPRPDPSTYKFPGFSSLTLVEPKKSKQPRHIRDRVLFFSFIFFFFVFPFVSLEVVEMFSLFLCQAGFGGRRTRTSHYDCASWPEERKRLTKKSLLVPREGQRHSPSGSMQRNINTRFKTKQNKYL